MSLRRDAEERLGHPPDFTQLTSDVALQRHLALLWDETALVFIAEAHLATVILCGSLLEGALLAKCLENDAIARSARLAPLYKRKPARYECWSLGNFIDVANEVGWILESRSAFATLLREYRNLIHPLNASRSSHSVNKLVAAICLVVVKKTIGELGVAVEPA